jgi:hypothetical protein
METKTIKLPLKKKNEDGTPVLATATVLTPTLGRMQRFNEHQNLILGLAEKRATTLGKYRDASQSVAALEAAMFDTPDDKDEKEKLATATRRANSLLARGNALQSDMYDLMGKRTFEITKIVGPELKPVTYEDVDWQECEGPVLNEAADFFYLSTTGSQNESKS